MRKILAILACLFPCTVSAQSVQQSGFVTAGHSACWAITGVIYDCGTPGGSSIVGAFTANDFVAVNGSGSLIDSGINPANTSAISGLWNFNGGATAPTRPNGDISTFLATTAFVNNIFGNPLSLTAPVTITIPTLSLGGIFGINSFALQTFQLWTGQTGTLTQPAVANEFLLQEGITTGTFPLDGWSFEHDVLGGNGQRNGMQITFNVPGNSTWSGISGGGVVGQLTALEITAEASANAGGFSSVALSGSLFALSPECFLKSGATFWASLDCTEFNISVATGASVGYLSVLKVAPQNDHAVHAFVNEAGLVFTAVGPSQVGLRCQICAGIYIPGNGSPFGGDGTTATASTYMGLFNPVSFKNGIDFSIANPVSTDLTTGTPFKSGSFLSGVATTNFQVDWYGNITASEIIGSGYQNSAGALATSNYLTLLSPPTTGSVMLFGNSADPSIYIRATTIALQDLAATRVYAYANAGGFAVGSPSGATIGAVVTSVATNGAITINGSTSGAITAQPQAVAGTFNWNWPITAGSSGQVLLSAAGGSSPMTWSSTLTGFTHAGLTTFTGQLISTFGATTIASGACGATTNGTVAGTNASGLITIASATTTVCTVSFSTTITAPGACVIAAANAKAGGTVPVARVSSVGTTNFVITGTDLASTAYYYICL